MVPRLRKVGSSMQPQDTNYVIGWPDYCAHACLVR
jgi:hypothetical protein